jgi:hypothetical protein
MPTDEHIGQNFLDRAKHEPTIFDNTMQRKLIAHVLTIPDHIQLRVHAVSTEPSHVHVLVSWSIERSWLSMRMSVRTSITKWLKSLSFETNPLLLSRGSSRKRVHHRSHFEYLMGRYLPKHSGVQWYEDRGWVEAKRDAKEKTRDA